MKIQFKIILAMVVWAHFVIVATALIGRVHTGVAVAFLLLWVLVLVLGFVGLGMNWEDTERWWNKRKEAKAKSQTPPKGDWKG